MVRDEDQVPREMSPRWEVSLAADEGPPGAPRLRALDVRAHHRILKAMSEDDLARIPLLPQGQRLIRYKEHLDLHDPARANFLADGTEAVKPGQRVVAKGDVTREIWDRLVESAHDVVGWRRGRTA